VLDKFLNYWFSLSGIKEIVSIFEKNNYDIRFVGGCVRDAFLGHKNPDIDFAVDCSPDIAVNILKENKVTFLEHGKKFGTLTIIEKNRKYEITSLREDLNPKGRFTDVKFIKDWKKDALRRDFTFNAININSNGNVEDYFNGQKDIELQQVKFIGDIENRIKEDYLRIVRFFRFLGLFQNPILTEEDTRLLNSKLIFLRKNVSNNKIKTELLKMFKNKFILNSITDLDDQNRPNILIQTIKKWWIEDKFQIGIDECISKIDTIIANQRK